MGTFRMLYNLQWKAHKDALKEVLFITIVSITPILLGAVARWSQIENTEFTLSSYNRAMDSFLEKGELFLYALAFVATIWWASVRDWPHGVNPPRLLLGLFCILSFGMIIVFYCLDSTKVATHVEVVLIFSKITFILTLIMYYLATILGKIEPPNLALELAKSSGDLSEQLGRSKGQ